MSFPALAPGSRSRSSSPTSRPASPRRLPWGWLEWFLIAQTFIPAVLFLPGVTAIRPMVRVASFGLALFAWFIIYQSGRKRSGTESFAASTWLLCVAGWLCLVILHPNTNSLVAGLAHAMLYISVFSPVFWAPSELISSRQIGRLMMILLLCNGLSSIVGLGQVFRPATFNPPVIQGLEDKNSLSSQALTYQDEHGNEIIRPCGLTDQVGAASAAGATTVLIGLAFALRPIGIFKRMISLGFAFAGMAVIYYSQVRMILLMLMLCLIVLVVILTLQRNFGHATLLGGLSAATVAGALTWVASTSGWSVVERFIGLLDTNLAEKYQSSRGGFVRHTFDTLIWEYPFGTGLGWWGTIYGVFGDKSVPSTVWVEVMWPAWVMDGGIPLMVLYVIAIVLAMADTLRIALRSRDRELQFWAGVVFASNLSVIATTFSYVSFVTAIGLQFWMLAAVVHAADLRVRATAAAAAKAKRDAMLAQQQQPEAMSPASPLPPSSTSPPSPAQA